MTRSTDHLVEDIEVKDMQINDHFWAHCNLLGQKPKTSRKEITSRKTKTLDRHAPVVTKTISIHPETPWFKKDIELAKRERMQAEKTWRKTHHSVHKEIFIRNPKM